MFNSLDSKTGRRHTAYFIVSWYALGEHPILYFLLPVIGLAALLVIWQPPLAA